MNLVFILIVSALSWYQWSDSVWVEEARQKLRNRVEESRRKRNKPRAQRFESVSDISSTSISNDVADEDDEDISIIDDKSIVKLDEEEIEELMAERTVRKRKARKYVDVSMATDEHVEESAC